MIRVLFEEWQCGRRFLVGRGIPVLVGVLVLGWTALKLPPETVMEGLGLGLLAVGLASGTRFWNGDPGWDWRRVRETNPWGYAAGKFVGWLATSTVSVLALSPILVLLTLQWDLPWSVTAGALGWALVGGAGAQGLGQLVTWEDGSWGRLFGSVLVLVWIGYTLVEPSLRPWNPLWQIRQILTPGAPSSALFAAQVTGVLVVLWTGLVLVWRGMGRTP
jgi:hypothetical protein